MNLCVTTYTAALGLHPRPSAVCGYCTRALYTPYCPAWGVLTITYAHMPVNEGDDYARIQLATKKDE